MDGKNGKIFCNISQNIMDILLISLSTITETQEHEVISIIEEIMKFTNNSIMNYISQIIFSVSYGSLNYSRRCIARCFGLYANETMEERKNILGDLYLKMIPSGNIHTIIEQIKPSTQFHQLTQELLLNSMRLKSGDIPLQYQTGKMHKLFIRFNERKRFI